MNYSDTRFTLDVQLHQAQVSVSATLNDTARRLCVGFTDGRKPYVIAEGCTATFAAKKPDGFALFNACTVENNTIIYEFTTQTTNVIGTYECEIRLYNEDGKQLTSPRFLLVVDEQAINDDDVIDSFTEVTMLNQIIANETERIVKENERITAENERITTEDVRIANENQRIESESMRESAEQNRAGAEVSRTLAEEDRANKEQLRYSWECLRQDSESVRNSAESQRIANENEREKQENGRLNYEASRGSNESTRISNESTRQANEEIRQANETERIDKENKRIAAEKKREDEEIVRANEEASRYQAEEQRDTNEKTRISNENTRKEAETARIGAETARVNAESARATAEASRAYFESTRASAENNRVTAETLRVSAENRRKESMAEIESSLLDKTYPVGSIYMSVNSTSPATLFGGSWTQLKNSFLVGAGGTYGVKTEGGATSHSHGAGTLGAAATYTSSPASILIKTEQRQGINYTPGARMNVSSKSDYTQTIDWVVPVYGSTASEDYLPPYYAVYMWRRDA